MDWLHFEHSGRILGLLFVLLLVIVYTWMITANRGHLGAFLSKDMQGRLVTRPTFGSRVLQIVCLALCGILFVFAWMQPQVIREERVASSKDAANIFVALDVSKSMLATDAVPNRLERAKSEIRDMLPSLAPHRVGLLAFAGRTTVLSPLTMDHGFFKLALDNASHTSVTLGGTSIGEVIRKGTALLEEQEGPKAMILITDGEDHDSYPVEAAQEARRAGIVIITVGFGSEEGTTIEVMDRATGVKKRVTDASGADVISRLDGGLLRDIALKTNGVYVPAQTGVLELESIMTKSILPLVDDSDQVRVQEMRIDLFQWFVGCGLLFFLGFMLLEGRGLTRQAKEGAA